MNKFESFNHSLNFVNPYFLEDAPAYEKLADGLRKFAIEADKTDAFIVKNLWGVIKMLNWLL